jgi:hypothetical protein
LTDELLKWRSEFPILDKTVYLISSQPRRYAESDIRPYAGLCGDLGDAGECVRGLRVGGTCRSAWAMRVGRIIGAEPGTVVMHQNVSICQAANPFVLRALHQRETRSSTRNLTFRP